MPCYLGVMEALMTRLGSDDGEDNVGCDFL